MPAEVVHLGAVGFGRHFRRYLLPNVVAEPGLSLRAVAERDPHLREEVARRLPGVEVYAEADDLLAAGGCDAVLISTAPLSHVDLTRAALEHGHHAFVEKPLGTSAAEVARLGELAASAGLVLANGLMWRHAPVTAVLQGWLRRREAHTQLLSLSVTLPAVDPSPPWRGEWGLPLRELVYFDAFLHPVDWAVQLLGPIASVTARELRTQDTRAGRFEVAVTLCAAAGPTGLLALVTGSAAYQVAAWGHASDGSLWELDTLQRLRVTTAQPWSGTEGGIRDRPAQTWEPGQIYRGWGRQGYAEELRAFAAAVRRGAPTPAGEFAATAHSYAVVGALVESAAGTEVAIPAPAVPATRDGQASQWRT